MNRKACSFKKNTSIPARTKKGIEVKIIMSESNPANLRLYEAFYIRKYEPTLNSRVECIEFADLLI